MRGIGGFSFQRLDDDRFDPVVTDFARRTATGLIVEPIEPV
jgi:hypothetical protein